MILVSIYYIFALVLCDLDFSYKTFGLVSCDLALVLKAHGIYPYQEPYYRSVFAHQPYLPHPYPGPGVCSITRSFEAFVSFLKGLCVMSSCS